MYDFQDDGVKFLRSTSRAILGDDPGLGKSRQALLAAEGRTLIVAPAMILDAGVWQHEVSRWRPDLDVRAVSYSKLCRREKGPRGGSKPVPQLDGAWAEHWDTVIADEAHYLKNRSTTWTQAFEKLNTDRLYLLTGTAIPNWAHEIYMLLKLTHPGDRRFTSYWRWIGEWFTEFEVKYGKTRVKEIGGLKACKESCQERPPGDPCEHWLEFQTENLRDCFLRRVRDDVLTDLPPLTETTIEVAMVGPQLAAYRSMKRDFLLEVGDGEIVAWTDSARTANLRKIATGLELVDPETQSSAKLDMLQALMVERFGQSTLIVCFHRDAAEHAKLRLEGDGHRVACLSGAVASKANRRQIVDDFKSGKVPVLIASLELVKEGLTLTQADQCIFLEHSWRPSTNEQTLRRIHRIGQDRPVTAIHLVTAKSLDANMQKEIANKTDQQVRALPITRIQELV